MRTILITLALLSASVFAQTATTPRGTYTEIDIDGPDVGRGPAGWRIFRSWEFIDATHVSGYISAFVVTSNGNQVFQYPNDNFAEGYNAFVIANAAASTPTEPGRVTATYSTVQKLIFGGGGSEPNFICKFTAPSSGPSSYSFNVVYRDSASVLMSTVPVTLNVPNAAPTVSLSASPSAIIAGGSSSFTPTASDVDTSNSISFSYNYGDGNSGSAASHTFAAAGTYTVTVAANDGAGGSSTATATVTVYGAGNVPTARFEVSNNFIVVGTPFTVSASVSTDPQNQLSSYSWNFGDSSTGTGATLSHVYASTGIVTISLTVTDAQGLTASTSQDFDVLDANAGAIEDAELTYDVRYNTGLSSKDYISLKATVNIGDAKLINGSSCTVSIYGVTFGGTLNRRLKFTSGATKLQIKNGTRRQPFGQVQIALQARNVNGLGTALRALIGSLAVEDTQTDVTIVTGGKTFTIPALADATVSLLKGTAHGEY